MPSQPSVPLPHSLVRVPRSSTVDLIAVELRSAIFSGALPVGSPLGEVEVARQLGVSRGPLREAAQRLVQEGLLTSLPGRGLRVSVIGPEGVSDLYTMRRAIEGEALRRIVSRERAGIVAELEGALDRLVRATASASDARMIGDADLAFHQALVDAAGSRRLSQQMSSLAIETRIASFSVADGYAVPAEVSPTYRRLLDAITTGDAASALSALNEQFDQAIARLTGVQDVDTVEPPPDETPATLTPIEVPLVE